jgi:hypothetical protein
MAQVKRAAVLVGCFAAGMPPGIVGVLGSVGLQAFVNDFTMFAGAMRNRRLVRERGELTGQQEPGKRDRGDPHTQLDA